MDTVFSIKDAQHIYRLYHIALALSNPNGAHGFVVCLEEMKYLKNYCRAFPKIFLTSLSGFTKADSVWSYRSSTECLEKQMNSQVGQFIKNFEERVFLLIGYEVYEKIELSSTGKRNFF